MKDDGSVVVWYRYNQPSLAAPPSAIGVAQVGAAVGFALAAKKDGGVVAWGECSTYGACTPPSGLVVKTT